MGVVGEMTPLPDIDLWSWSRADIYQAIMTYYRRAHPVLYMFNWRGYKLRANGIAWLVSEYRLSFAQAYEKWLSEVCNDT